MGTKNRKARGRRGKRQYSRIDNQTVSNAKLDQSIQSAFTDSDDNSSQNSDSSLINETMVTSLNNFLSLANTFIENTTKYVIHLLYLFILNKVSSMLLNHTEDLITTNANNQCNEEDKEKEINQKPTEQTIETSNSNDEELLNVEKDSDSSKNQSNNASNMTEINMPLENTDNCIPQTALEKPIDISTEKHNSNEKQSPINTSEDTKSFADKQQPRQHSYFSENRGIARNFEQKSTFYDKMCPPSSFPKSFASYRYKKLRQTNSSYYGGNRKYSNNFSIKPWFKRNETEQKKEFAPTNENKKFTFNKEKSEKHVEWRNKNDTQGKRRSSQYYPAKYKSHYWRKPVENQESKQCNPKYKDVGTQTDSIFPTNSDAEKVSIKTICPEQEACECATQDKDINQELNYKSDIEELLKLAHKQLSSYNTSSSSTDFRYDAEMFTTLVSEDIAEALWNPKLYNDTNNFKEPIRPPPGFREVPQNPPSIMPSLADIYEANSHIKPPTVIPPAPPPMQHLYYDYSAFMKPPTFSN